MHSETDCFDLPVHLNSSSATYLLTWPLASYLSAHCSFFIYKKGIITVIPFRGVGKIKWIWISFSSKNSDIWSALDSLSHFNFFSHAHSLSPLGWSHRFKYPYTDNSPTYISSSDRSPEPLDSYISSFLLNIATWMAIDISNLSCPKLNSRLFPSNLIHL